MPTYVDKGYEALSCVGCTLDEVAQFLGVSRERARQIEIKALEKLQAGIYRAMQEDFIKYGQYIPDIKSFKRRYEAKKTEQHRRQYPWMYWENGDKKYG